MNSPARSVGPDTTGGTDSDIGKDFGKGIGPVVAQAIGEWLKDAGGVLRRYLCLAPVSEGRTADFLRDRLVVLPLLTVIAFGALSMSYGGVHGDSAHVSEESAPALVDLTRAEVSLAQAQKEAESALSGPSLVGLDQNYRGLITRATQNLNKVAQTGALNAAQRQSLQVVSGLVIDYNDYVGRADRSRADSTLSSAYLLYALSMLCETTGSTPQTARCTESTARGYEATTIQDRIGSLERSLRADLADEAGWGTGPMILAAVAGVACVLLAVGLLRTLNFLRIRFRLLSLPLAGAVLPLLVLPVLVLGTVQTHQGQTAVRQTVEGALARVDPASVTPAVPDPIDTLQRSIDGSMHRAHSERWAAVTGFILPVGLLSATATGWALLAYRRDYVRVPGREEFH
ncbi:hypothetical protein AB0436_16520 [Streptomyces sp. NPDC051322]|uniref:hypothetical protein n=1 Tax=Streptomyces sp. NPDC051322 TaxID=3154645 RepID=UPI00344CC5AA